MADITGAGVGLKAFGDSMRQYVEDRRGDVTWKQQEEAGELGLQKARREERVADLDEKYTMYKHEMSGAMQQFAMDPRNYQPALDAINRQYGQDYALTHREGPGGDIDFTLTYTDENGETQTRGGLKREDIGAYIQMAQSPVVFAEKEKQNKREAAAKEDEQAHDLDKIDRKGEWDVRVAKIRSAGSDTSASTALSTEKELSKLATNAFTKLREDGVISFGEGYDDQYASYTAEYATQLFNSGRAKTTTAAHRLALDMVKDEITRWENDPATDGMSPEAKDEWVRDKVSDVMAMRSGSLMERAAEEMTGLSGVERAKKDPKGAIGFLRTRGKSDEEIKAYFEKNGIPWPEEQAGLQDKDEAQMRGEMATEQAMTADATGEPSPQTVAPGQTGEQLAQVGADDMQTVPTGEGDVEFGGTQKFGSTESAVSRKQSMYKSRNEKLARGITDERGKTATWGGGEQVTSKLKQLRDKAAERVMAAAEGRGKITKRVILEAALKSGKLPDKVRRDVEAALRGKTSTMLAEGS